MSEAEDQGTASTGTMSLRGAVSLGIGAMVGAGIFALLGEAGAIAGAGVWVSFLIAGLISIALGYGMAKLGAKYPSAGGLITYLIQGFGNGRLVAVAAWLGYLTAIVVVGAMVAVSFGEYAAAILPVNDAEPIWNKVFASALVVGAALLCIVGPRMLDRAQSAIVIGLLLVFGVFIVATLSTLDLSLLAPDGYPPVRSIVSSVALTFFAYLGFAVISFAAGDLKRPERTLPRAMYIALGVTTLLYVAIAVGVFGTLTVPEVVEYGPRAIAEAARPSLGDAGFVAMAIAALLATSSSVTATLYASEGLTGTLAEVGQFPTAFGTASRLGRPWRVVDHLGAHPAVRHRLRPRGLGIDRKRGFARRLRARRLRRRPTTRHDRRTPLDPARGHRLFDHRPLGVRSRHARERPEGVLDHDSPTVRGTGRRPGVAQAEAADSRIVTWSLRTDVASS